MSKGRSVPSFCVDGFSSLRKGDARVSEFGFGNEGEGGSPSGFPFRIALHEEVASTNDEVKRALEAGEPEGLVVRALRQVSGYGRQGRSWTSPEGGLYCSLLLRPQVAPRELPTLSLVVGMAVRRALVALAGARAEEAVRIKWPNDVVLAQKARYARFPEATEIRDLGFSESGKELGQKNRAQRLFCANEGDACSARDGRAPDFAKLCGISLEAHGGGVCVGVGVSAPTWEARIVLRTWPTSRIPLPRRPSLSKQCSKRSSPPSRRCTVYGGATASHRLWTSSTPTPA